jgi:hypothetical protein
MARQEGLLEMGRFFTGEMMKQKASLLNAPKTVGEAESVAPGMIQPLPSQRFSPAPYAEGIGATPPANPNATLQPFQQAVALQAGGALAKGELMNTPEGIVPANYATYNGRYMMDPTDAVAAVKQATGVNIQPPSKPVPATVINSMISNISAGSRQDQRLERPTVAPDVNALAGSMFGKPYWDLDPASQSKVMDASLGRWQDKTRFTNQQYIDRAVASAGPVAAARTQAVAQTERAQPVGGDITKYAKISADGLNIDRPTDPNATTNDLNKQGYVDISKFHTQVEGLNDLDVIQQDLRKLKGYADILFKSQPGLMNAVKQAGSLSAAQLSNGGKPVTLPDGRTMTIGQLANLYDREVASTLDYYGKKLKGAVGTQTEQDAQRMAKNFAGVWTSEAVKDALMQDTDKLINNRRKGLLRTVFGKDAVDKTKGQPSKAPAQGQDRSEDAARARIQELKAQGLSKEAIKSQLLKEGFK